ncbi:STAS domain-containing protein [Streptomyces sp. NPDC101118]|uniref:STAS domain-containing protein n=1 Tax=Streptomyces sp. NPDC101118 TaxID=3366109 RepID=UPI0038118E2C
MITDLIALEAAVDRDGMTRMALSGELDILTAAQVRGPLTRSIAPGGPDLVLDITGLTFCDSSGIGLFLDLDHSCRAAGARLRLTGVPQLTAVALRLLGADRVLAYRPS